MTDTMTSSHPTGRVLATHDGRADVSTRRVGACAGCSEAGSCTIRAVESCEEVVTVRNGVGARVGDVVELGLPGRAALQLSLLVWLVPALGLVLGALCGAWVGGDLATLVGALAGTAASWALLRRIDRAAGESAAFTPFITRIRERRGA